MKDLKQITKKLIEFWEVRDWQQFHNPKDLAISLSLEASEVLEHFQWKSEKEIEEYIKTNKYQIGEELADVFNWILLMCHDLNIDITQESIKKIQKNAIKYPVDKARGKSVKYNKL